MSELSILGTRMGKHGDLGRLEAEKAALETRRYRCSDRVCEAYQCAEIRGMCGKKDHERPQEHSRP